MMLLGVLSHVSWMSFLTGLLLVDVCIVGIGFALDKMVWSKQDGGLTKNEKRNSRDDDDDGYDYEELSNNAASLVRIRSIEEDDFSDRHDDYAYETHVEQDVPSPPVKYASGYEDFSPEERASDDDLVIPPVEDETEELPEEKAYEAEEEQVSENELEEQNSEAQSLFEYEVIGYSNFDSDVDFLTDQDKQVVSSDDFTEEKWDEVYVMQDGIEPIRQEDDDDDVVIGEDDEVQDLLSDAQPLSLFDAVSQNPEEPEEPSEPEEPDFF